VNEPCNDQLRGRLIPALRAALIGRLAFPKAEMPL
jgi:hypothetical protein